MGICPLAMIGSEIPVACLWGHRQEENAVWDLSEAKEACLRRLGERNFPAEMRAVAEASDRFYELGVYYRNPLEVMLWG